MGIPHVQPGEVVNLYQLPAKLGLEKTFALTKTKQMEVIRMTIPKGKIIPAHQVTGEVSIFCLDGKVEFQIEEKLNELSSGDWLYMNGGDKHSLRAVTDSSLLVTISL